MTLEATGQADYSGGIYRGRRSPQDALYDAVNFFVDDEGQLVRRAGAAMHSTSDAGVDLLGVVTASLAGPDAERTIAWSQKKLFVLDGSLAPVQLYEDASATTPFGRPANVGGVLIFPLAPRPATTVPSVPAHNAVLGYGGSLKSAGIFNVGSITVTAGSDKVTKTGGATWVGAIDAGMFLLVSGAPHAIVRSVDGADALTLVNPWAGSTDTTSTYQIDPVIEMNLIVGSSPLVAVPPLASRLYLGAAGQRLLVGARNRVYIPAAGFPLVLNPNAYHEFPGAISGIEGLGDTAFVFTSRGVWRISRLSLDTVDDEGTPQHQVDRLPGDLALWGEHGITSFAGGLVVPAYDDVWVLGSGQLGVGEDRVSITGDAKNEKARRLWREHTSTEGRRPGNATVYQGHLFLPVVADDLSVADVLVCRLDRGGAWTRLSGFAAGGGFAVAADPDADAPLLLGVNGERVIDVTPCLAGAAVLDADGTAADATLVTRDYPLSSSNHPGTAASLRARYEMDGAGVGSVSTDDFSRSDEEPLDSPYSAWRGVMPHLVDQAIVNGPGVITPFADAWTTRPETIGPACFAEIHFAEPVTPSGITNYGVGARLTAHSAAADGYTLTLEAGLAGAVNVRITRGAALTTIARSQRTDWADIEAIRLTAAGIVLRGWVKTDGEWHLAVTAVDSAYQAAGYVGFWTSNLLEQNTAIVSFQWGAYGAEVGVEVSSDQDAGAWSPLTSRGDERGKAGWGDSDASGYQWARVGKRRPSVRFRFTVSGAATFTFRMLEVLARQGRLR